MTPLTALTALTALDDAIENLGVPVPCRSYDPEVFFAESPADVEYAKYQFNDLNADYDTFNYAAAWNFRLGNLIEAVGNALDGC